MRELLILSIISSIVLAQSFDIDEQDFDSEEMHDSSSASGITGSSIIEVKGEFSVGDTILLRNDQGKRIAKAKAKGVYDNRKRKKKVSDKRITELKTNGLNNTEIAKHLGVSRMTIHRALASA